MLKEHFLELDKIDENVDFYILGLKPNSSRLSVKFIFRKKYADANKIDYIDLYNVLKNRKYLFYINDNNLPNKDANIMISNEILKKYNQKST